MKHYKLVLPFLFFALFQIQAKEKQEKIKGFPVINDPVVVGNRVNTPFLFTIPASGERPMKWSAQGLPDGLVLDENSGIISGKATVEGLYNIALCVSNRLGETRSNLEIRIGKILALTPPMGWNGWNLFMCEVNEQLVKEMADALVSTGLRDLGYQYINLDDGWQEENRDINGDIVINRTKFPNGIKYLADYLHDRGLKLGIYSDAAEYTCEKRAGSYGYEKRDVEKYVEWGVDFLKYDYCFAPESKDTAIVRYRKMAETIQHCGRSIVFSVCEWGDREPWTWAPGLGANLWRTTQDIRDIWVHKSKKNNGIFQIFEKNIRLADVAGPGKWNDPDMLLAGLYGKGPATTRGNYVPTLAEYRAQFALWCLMASPLLISTDIRSMKEEIRSVLMHKELIKINQDRLGKQAQSIIDSEDVHVIAKPLSDGSYAIGILNKRETKISYKLIMKDLNFGKVISVKDIWKNEPLPDKKESLFLEIDAHDCLVFQIRAKK